MAATRQLVVELQTELNRLQLENVTLKQRNAELECRFNRLKKTLDEATKLSKAQREQIVKANSRADVLERRLSSVPAQATTPETTTSSSSSSSTISGLRSKLSETSRRMSDYRKRLSDVQERLAVIEQVTILTQTRELKQDDYCNTLLEENEDDCIYQNLFLDSTQLKPLGGKLL